MGQLSDNLLRGQTEQVKSKRKALQEEEAKYYKDNPQSTLTLTSTEWTTPFGMPVYTDQHGQRHSESSETIRFANDKWGAVPMIWPDPETGKARYFTPQETQALVEANNYINPVSGKPIALFGSEPEATNAAIDRDLILRDKNHPWNQPTQLSDKLTQGTTDPKEDDFQRGIRGTSWFSDFVKQYGEEPDLRPVSEDPALGPNYDYRKAWAAGVRPEPDPYDNNRQHWPSSSPDGKMLKSKNHPTAWKEPFMRQYGVNPDSLPSSVSEWLVEGMPSR